MNPETPILEKTGPISRRRIAVQHTITPGHRPRYRKDNNSSTQDINEALMFTSTAQAIRHIQTWTLRFPRLAEWEALDLVTVEIIPEMRVIRPIF